jgi:hypothetical protein
LFLLFGINQSLDKFIADLDPEFPYSGDTDPFVMLFMAVDGQEQIGNETTEHLRHETMGTSGDHMVDIEVLLPPTEELLDVPAEFVGKGNLFSSQIKPVSGDVVVDLINAIANHTNWLLGLVYPLCPKQSSHIKKNVTPFGNDMLRYDAFSCALLDPDDEVTFL